MVYAIPSYLVYLLATKISLCYIASVTLIKRGGGTGLADPVTAGPKSIIIIITILKSFTGCMFSSSNNLVSN